jgi:selenide, water dikinase
VGLGAADDAAVYRLDDDLALVATTDFFTPIVDDAYAYGAIAAANALSDVYAMGGRPIFALNIVALPNELPAHLSAEIIRGGAEKVREAGAVIAGGHSIQDAEPKYGLVVLGLAHVNRLLTKGGARPGDILVLTKPLGTGVITTAVKRDLADPGDVTAAIASMMRLNRTAAEAALAAGVHGATDVTGFGLLGHACEMAEAAGVRFRFSYGAMRWLSGALSYGEAGAFAGGASNNRRFFESHVTFADKLTDVQRMMLWDPQTSGGLLVAVPHQHLDQFHALAAPDAWVIGEVTEGEGVEVGL